MSLPNLIVIGAMKCGTCSLHWYLGAHPEIVMSDPKELNFFVGTPVKPASGWTWTRGNWHRGVDWYAQQFDPAFSVRGESSPTYTSPAHPSVAARMAALIPRARLLYVVRDPVERAISQYRHHFREGDETRGIAEALLDSGSQYLARSRYYERLQPFLEHFAAEQIAIESQEELLVARRATLRRIFDWLGVEPGYWSSAFERCWNVGDPVAPHVPRVLRDRFATACRDDVERLSTFVGRTFDGWGGPIRPAGPGLSRRDRCGNHDGP